MNANAPIPATERSSPRGAAAGMTLVEVAIAGALLIVVVLAAVGSTTMIQSLIRTGSAEAGTVARVREVLHELRQDLLATSLAPDPVSGDSRLRIEVAANGGQRLRLRRLNGAALQTGSLVAVWSPWITWEMDEAGAVWRTIDGDTPRLIARGMQSMAFAVLENRVVSASCRSANRSANGDRVTPAQLAEIVMPRY